jgi:DNA-binding LacI/PurR family transcriptional regulator
VTDIIARIHIDSQHGITLAHQIKSQITWLIVSGILKPGDRLPSVRLMSKHLGINLHTVRNAYRMLEDEGLVETRQGWGTKVLAPDPLRIGKSSASIQSHTIGVILPSLSNPVYHDFLQGVQEIADDDHSMIFVCNTQDQPLEAWRYLNQLLSKHVDGIIVASQDIEQFIPETQSSEMSYPIGIPFVSVDWPDSKAYSITIDLEGAGYQATRHLIQHGHKRIGLITFGFETTEFRLEDVGYKRALSEAGIPYDPGLITLVQGFGVAAGERGAARLLHLASPPSAIFAITDLMAIGTMRVIRAAGLQIPDDIALVGFNDIPIAAVLDLPLTSVRLPGYQMGVEAMKMLASLIRNEQPKQRIINLPTNLVIRRSCGCQIALESS